MALRFNRDETAAPELYINPDQLSEIADVSGFDLEVVEETLTSIAGRQAENEDERAIAGAAVEILGGDIKYGDGLYFANGVTLEEPAKEDEGEGAEDQTPPPDAQTKQRRPASATRRDNKKAGVTKTPTAPVNTATTGTAQTNTPPGSSQTPSADELAQGKPSPTSPPPANTPPQSTPPAGTQTAQ